MKRNLFLLMSLSLLMILASCGTKGGETGLLVPEDAAIVVHINNSSLSSKLTWEEIQQSNWYRELSKEAKDTMAQQLLSDPAVSGVDSKADFVFFFKKQNKGAYLVIEGSLKDAAAFEKFVTKLAEGNQPEKKGDFYSLITPEKGVLSWNKTHFAYVDNMNLPDNDFQRGFGGDYKEKQVHTFSPDSLAYFGSETLTLSKSKRLDKDKRFASLVKDGGDIHLWMNSGEYYSEMMGPMMSMMGDLASLTKDNVSAATFNFDNGKITMDSKQYYGAKLNAVFAKYPAKSIDKDLINRIPSQNVVAALAMNYPPEGLKEFLKVTNLEGMVNMFVVKAGYSVDEFIKANKGDILVAVSDLSVKQKTDSMDMGAGADPYVHTSRQPDVHVLFATSVNDKASFEKLITLLWEQSKGMMSKDPGITYKLENNWFAAGNSADQVNQFLSGKTTSSPVADKLSGHPIGFYVDLQKILQVAAAENKNDTTDAAIFDASLKTWQDVIAYGGEFKNKAFEFHAEINMVDKNTNSLKQLNAYLDQVYIKMKSKQSDVNMVTVEPIIDSVAVPPPPPPAPKRK